MAKIAFNRVEYIGGATPFERPVSYDFNRTQLSFVGFDSDDATVEVLAVGADDYKEVTLSSTEHSMIINGAITSVRVSGVAAGSYSITAVQWSE